MTATVRRPARSCAFCKRTRTHLCDYPVRWIDTHGKDELGPCSLPICDEHRAVQDDGSDICPKCLKLAQGEAA